MKRRIVKLNTKQLKALIEAYASESGPMMDSEQTDPEVDAKIVEFAEFIANSVAEPEALGGARGSDNDWDEQVMRMQEDLQDSLTQVVNDAMRKLIDGQYFRGY